MEFEELVGMISEEISIEEVEDVFDNVEDSDSVKNSDNVREDVISIGTSTSTSDSTSDSASESDREACPIDTFSNDTSSTASSCLSIVSINRTELQNSPPPYPNEEEESWTESIETFINQLNDFDYSYDHFSETTVDISTDDNEDERETIEKLKKGQIFLVYLTVPVLISQLLMLIILANSGAQANQNQLIPVMNINHRHHHYNYNFYVFEERSQSSSKRGFFYIFFNPIGALLNSRYFVWICDEYKRQCSDPNSLISKLQGAFGSVRKGIEAELGNALKIRDNWNKAVYEKIYKVAASPKYQRAVSTISKWTGALKDRIFKK